MVIEVCGFPSRVYILFQLVVLLILADNMCLDIQSLRCLEHDHQVFLQDGPRVYISEIDGHLLDDQKIRYRGVALKCISVGVLVDFWASGGPLCHGYSVFREPRALLLHSLCCWSR
jgi:hypothetical protein